MLIAAYGGYSSWRAARSNIPASRGLTVGQLTQTPDGQGFMRQGAAQVTFDQVAVWLTSLNFMDPATRAILLGDSSAARVAAGVKTSLPVAQILVQGVQLYNTLYISVFDEP